MAPSYQVAVSYAGKKIIPAPFVSLTRDIQRSADGTVRVRGWKIQVKGKVSAWLGSPDNAGVFWTAPGYPPDPSPSEAAPELRVRNLKNKLGALTSLLNQDGHWFEIQPGDGSAPIKFLPRISSFEFAEGKWFDVVDYTLSMDADCVYFGAVQDPSCPFTAADFPAEESWGVEPADEFRPTWRLTHTLSAVARNRFKSDGSGAVDAGDSGWELARTSVLASQGYSATVVQTVFGLDPAYGGYNHHVSQQADKAAGKYTLTEAWLLSTANYTEDVTVDHSYSAETGLDVVKVNGTITGLQVGDDPATRFTNANVRAAAVSTEAALLAKAEAESGVTPLNPQARALTVARNRPVGTISYSGEFDTRPGITAGLLSESVSVTIDHAVPVVAQLGVIGRVFGPVLQPIGSYTQQSFSVQADLVVRVRYGETEPAIPSFDAAAAFAQYCGAPPTVYVTSDKEVWVPRTGRYSRSTSFIYQQV